jgi:hypothetical protein
MRCLTLIVGLLYVIRGHVVIDCTHFISIANTNVPCDRVHFSAMWARSRLEAGAEKNKLATIASPIWPLECH